MHDLQLQLVQSVVSNKNAPEFNLSTTCALLEAIELPHRVTTPHGYPREDRVILVSEQVHVDLHELPAHKAYSCEVVRLTREDELFHYGKIITLERLLHDVRLALSQARRHRPARCH